MSIPDFPLFYFHNISAPKVNGQKIEQGEFLLPNQLIKEFVYNAYDNYMPLHTEPLRLLVVGSDA